MQPVRVIAVVCVVSAALQAVVCDARMLRNAGSSTDLVASSAAPIPTNKEIKEKWDKMDEFLKVMFAMACKWKHGKDIDGLAAEKIKNGDLKSASDVRDFKKSVQQKNVQHMKTSCGKLTGDGKYKCRQSCSDRWGSAVAKRQDCDKKCVTVYDRFEGSCESKADDLVKIYDLKQSKAKGMKTCQEGFCKKFPTVWMKDNKDMEKERDTLCKDNICTDDGIKSTCQKKWHLEADGHAASVAQECFDDSKMKSCFEKKKGTADSDETKCASDGKKTCGTAFDDCKTKGKVDKTFKDAKAFCTDRQKMCNKQVSEKCLAAHKASLEKAQSDCDADAKKDAADCNSKKLKKAETDAMDKCKTDEKKTCGDDCKASCQITKMQKCLADLKSEDPAKMFCLDFWTLLHDTSEVDPVTGNPIVLLAAQNAGKH